MTEDKGKKDQEKCTCGYDCCSPKYSRKYYSRGGENWGAIYFFGIIGTAVYYVQQVSGFWPVVLAILKAIVWPAFLLYKVFQMLHM